MSMTRIGPLRLLVLAMVLCTATGRADGASAQDRLVDQPIDLAIYGLDGKTLLGHSHFAISRRGDMVEIRGEAHYLDGEYDAELERVDLNSSGGQMPVLETFSHRFFDAGGKLQRVAEADFRSGTASCGKDLTSSPREVHKTLSFPPDTYAGASVLIPLLYGLKQNPNDQIEFHAFNCVPDPKVLSVKATVDKTGASWSSYSGATRVELQADFGWWNLLVAPFLPKLYFWFDPKDDWRYLGGLITRFYRGPTVELVRIAPALKPQALSQESSAK